ncbi:MAG: linear amide C-N hydrolase [Phycisphaerales bacterium]
MSKSRFEIPLLGVLLVAAAVAGPLAPAPACTRGVYLGLEGQTVTGRTMDWVEDMQSNMWVFPRGMRRDGGMGDRGFQWTSRYGSVIVSAYEAGTTDGMNEKGLVANLLFLVETEYPPAEGDTRPPLPVSAWAQFVLDSFASVEEAVAALRDAPFRSVMVVAPNGIEGQVHLCISDSTGDSAIFQYLNGELVIHHGKEHQVLTNSPEYDQQLALNRYWEEVGGTTFLPGTRRSADRFARARFYINAAKQSADAREAVAATMSVMRNVSVPLGITTPDQPNLSSTIWRTVADQKNLVYYYDDSLSPELVWVDLKRIDFGVGSGVRKLTLHDHLDVGGDQTEGFKAHEPFVFLAPG